MTNVIEALALAVLEPSEPCLLIGPDNGRKGWERLDGLAGDPRRPYAGIVRRGVLFADFDQEDGLENADRARELLELQGFRPVVCASGGPGRAHLWIRTDGRADVANRTLEGLATETRENGPGRYARPPLSPHRTTGTDDVRLVWPPDPQEALERLRPPLSETVQKTLREGWPVGKRSEGLVSLALQYRNAGRTSTEYAADVMAHPQGAGSKTAGRRDARQYLEGRYRIAADYQRPAPCPETWLAAVEACENVKNGPANTAGGIARIWRRANGRPTLHLSSRDVADESGVTHETARAHLKKLAEAGYLERAKGARGRDAAEYRPTIPTGQTLTHRDRTPLRPYNECQENAHGDAFAGCPARRRLYERMPDSGAKVEGLLGLARCKAPQLRRHLRALEGLGLAERCGHGVWRPIRDPERLKDAAKLRGTSGTCTRRRWWHERQRMAWRLGLGVSRSQRMTGAERSPRRRTPVSVIEAEAPSLERPPSCWEFEPEASRARTGPMVC